MKPPFNKFLYIGFVLLGLFQAFFQKIIYKQPRLLVFPWHLTHSTLNKNEMKDQNGKKRL